jgi:hypothetical protein
MSVLIRFLLSFVFNWLRFLFVPFICGLLLAIIIPIWIVASKGAPFPQWLGIFLFGASNFEAHSISELGAHLAKVFMTLSLCVAVPVTLAESIIGKRLVLPERIKSDPWFRASVVIIAFCVPVSLYAYFIFTGEGSGLTLGVKITMFVLLTIFHFLALLSFSFLKVIDDIEGLVIIATRRNPN